MRAAKIFPACLLALIAVITSRSSRAESPAPLDDQQHAFDFHFGTWRTHILSRRSGASGAAVWVKMTGTVTDQPLWHGRANLEKIEASGAGSHFQGLTIFLYDPTTGQWSQRFAGSRDGILQRPVYGTFENGRGVFYGWSGSGGKRVLERDIWSNITPGSYHFQIASSVDGGKTWVTSFIAQLTRLKKDPDYSTSHTAGDGPEHDFDFNAGSWKTRIRAVLDPLSSPGKWSTLRGIHAVYRVWDGWADIGQLEVDGPDGHMEDLALRLYDRKTHQWRVYFASSRSGTLHAPMVGQFRDGAGTFVGLDEIGGKMVLTRNVWSRTTATSCRQHWAISADGGKTWTPTWVSTDVRESGTRGPGS